MARKRKRPTLDDLEVEEFGLDDLDPEDARAFVAEELKAAWRGDREAQCLVADAYRTGVGMPQDHAEARRWYRAAGKQGDPDAQNNLGVSYASGQGGRRDEEQALEWFRAAAAQGHAEAMNNLGVTYDSGDGVEQDDREVVKWFHRVRIVVPYSLRHSVRQIPHHQ